MISAPDTDLALSGMRIFKAFRIGKVQTLISVTRSNRDFVAGAAFSWFWPISIDHTHTHDYNLLQLHLSFNAVKLLQYDPEVIPASFFFIVRSQNGIISIKSRFVLVLPPLILKERDNKGPPALGSCCYVGQACGKQRP